MGKAVTGDTAVIYSNCTIITGEKEPSRATAFAVHNRSVLAVGDLDSVRSASPSGSREIDLAGAAVLPGFDDCHMHILSLGLSLGRLDVSPSITSSITGILRLVEQRASVSDGESWILGRGYNQNLLDEGRHPNRMDLDPVSGSKPVALWHTSGHVMAVNGAALKLAGITDSTPDPAGGEIERDQHGQATGVLKETAMGLVAGRIPPPTPAEATQAILNASSLLAREGITSASDAATGQHAGLEVELQAYRSALDSADLRTRIVLMPLIQQVTSTDEHDRVSAHRRADFDAGSRPEWLKIGPTKIFSDGALTTRTAALREPYQDGSGMGLLTWSERDLQSLVLSAHTAGWQIAAHAIGDAAVDAVLDAYELAHSSNPRIGARHRIEHCTIVDRKQIDRIGALGVVPVLQPEDIAVLGDAYPVALGRDRAANNSPVGWFLETGLPIAFSSDRPVTPGDPLAGIRAAVERRTGSGKILGEEHRIDAETAIRLYSAGGAYATFSEGSKGALGAGLHSDFVVLDRDITACPAEEITEARVLMTIVDGQAVFEA